MVTLEGLLVVEVGDALHVRGHASGAHRDSPVGPDDLPALNDEETCAVLFGLVRALRGDLTFTMSPVREV